MHSKYAVAISLIGFAMSACTSSAPVTAIPTQPSASGYLAPFLTGYPGPEIDTSPFAGTPQPPSEAPPPSVGKASLAGVFFSRTTKGVVPGTLFYLTPAIGEDQREPPAVLGDPNVARGDIIGTTNAMGQFSLRDIPPGNYYLFIWAPYDWRPAEKGEEDQGPRLITLQADESVVLGIVFVSWP